MRPTMPWRSPWLRGVDSLNVATSLGVVAAVRRRRAGLRPSDCKLLGLSPFRSSASTATISSAVSAASAPLLSPTTSSSMTERTNA